MAVVFIGVMSVSFSTSTGSLLVTGLQRRWMQFDQTILANFSPHNSENEDFRPDPGCYFHDWRMLIYTIIENSWFQRATSSAIVCNCAILLSDGYPRGKAEGELMERIDLGFVCICKPFLPVSVKRWTLLATLPTHSITASIDVSLLTDLCCRLYRDDDEDVWTWVLQLLQNGVELL
jgi:hypothetical protein